MIEVLKLLNADPNITAVSALHVEHWPVVYVIHLCVSSSTNRGRLARFDNVHFDSFVYWMIWEEETNTHVVFWFL